jgi:hypothetical protein
MTFEELCKIAIENDISITVAKTPLCPDGVEIRMRKNSYNITRVLRPKDIHRPSTAEYMIEVMLGKITLAEARNECLEAT